MRRRGLLLVPLLLFTVPQFVIAAPAPPEIAFEQRPGAQLPEQNIYRDDTGRTVRLAELLGENPLVLVLGYFHCHKLCTVARGDLLQALRAAGLVAGQDYTGIALSVDPSETSTDAAAAKAIDLERYPASGAVKNWHYLTGAADTIQAINDAVGFRDRTNPERNTFDHPTGVVFVSPSGLVSSYLLGVGYQPSDVRLAVTRAATGVSNTAATPVLLLCYDYDPKLGRYTLTIMKLLRLATAISVMMIAGAVFFVIRRKRRT